MLGLAPNLLSRNAVLFYVVSECIFKRFDDLNTWMKEQGTEYVNAIDECYL
jgi:hypothetical protein